MDNTATLTYGDHLEHLKRSPDDSVLHSLDCVDDLVMQAQIGHLRHRHSLDSWEAVPIERLSFSHLVRAFSALGEEELKTSCARYRRRRHRRIDSSSLRAELESRIELARQLFRQLDCGELTVKLRVPSGIRDVNSISVETTSGYRHFHVQHGDLLKSDSDLLVVATHNRENEPLTGLWVRMIERQHGLAVEPTPLLRVSSRRWTCFLQRQGDSGLPHLLILRIPRLSEEPDPVAAYEETVQSIWASMAALEGLDFTFPSVSVPAILASRIVDNEACIEVLVRRSVEWLRKSTSTETIRFVVFFADELERWDSAMNSCLGRTTVSSSGDGLLNSLRIGTLQMLQRLERGCLESAVRPLLTTLEHDDELCVEHICVFGRKLAELIAHEVMQDLDIRPTTSLMANIEALRCDGKVAPWVCSYMHTLRVLGNETVHGHLAGKAFTPQNLGECDLISGLTAIRSLVSFWSDRHL